MLFTHSANTMTQLSLACATRTYVLNTGDSAMGPELL